MASSSLGFGSSPWGDFPWGNSDWAEQMLWKAMPEFYRLMDKQGHGLVSEPLRGFVNAIKPPMEELRRKTRDFPNLWNADEAPVKHLPSLARTIGLNPSTDKPEVFQRLEILNAHQLYLHKGTDKGYRIVGSFDGLDVIVEGLYAENCEPGAILSTNEPEFWVPHFDDIPADEIHMDSVYEDRFALWPWTLLTSVVIPGGVNFDEIPLDTLPLDSGLTFTEGRCRSYSLSLTFFKPDDTEIEDFTNVSRRVTRLVNFMKPLHVRLDKVDFDGPKASATWVQSITGDNPAATTWVSQIGGLLEASATWVTDITADLAG
jgi:hypothetical protein